MTTLMIAQQAESQRLAGIYNRAIDKLVLDDAFAAEWLFYAQTAKIVENPDLLDLWEAETMSRRVSLLESVRNLTASAQTNEGNIGFLISNYSGLAHEEAVRELLTSYNKNPSSKFHLIYVCEENISRASGFYKNIFSTYTTLNIRSNFVSEMREKLLPTINRLSLGRIVVVTSYVIAYWLSLCKPSNVNVDYWAMKYYQRQIGHISNWVSGGGWGPQQLRSGTWVGIPPPVGFHQASITYNALSSPIIFGSISRVEKINNPRFLSCISHVLRETVNSIFFYTGRCSDNFVEDFFAQEQLSHRVKFVGWVDPISFLNNVTLYVEPFPFGGGQMLMTAASAGIPIHYLLSDRFEQIKLVHSYFLSLHSPRELEDLRFFSRSEEEYRSNIIDLIRDAGSRRTISNKKILLDRARNSSSYEAEYRLKLTHTLNSMWFS